MKLMAELSRVVPAEQRNFIQYYSGDFMLQATRPNVASSAQLLMITVEPFAVRPFGLLLLWRAH